MSPIAPTTAPAEPAPEALDPTIVNLAKAIRHTETRGATDPYTAKGASGEFGAYQYTPATWATDSKTFLGADVPLQQATKLQQNEVAYKKLESLKKQGYNVGQIASIWNSGSPEWEGKVSTGKGGKLPPNKFGVEFDVPHYVDSVAKTYQSIKNGQEPDEQNTASTVQPPVPALTPDQQSAQKYNPLFPASSSDTAVTAGLKTAGNLLPSAFNFAKGAVESFNPVNIIKNLSAIPGAWEALVKESGGVGNALKIFAGDLPGTAYESLVPEAGRELIKGNVAGAARAVTNDPFGQVAPFVFGAEGLAKGVDTVTGKMAEANMADYVNKIGENTKNGVPIPRGTGTNLTGMLDTAIEKTAGVVTKPASYVFGKAADVVGATGKYTASKVTGLDTSTIDQIKANPEQFTPEAINSMSRKSLGDEVGSALKKRSAAVAETGAEYAPIRESKTPVKVDPNYIDKTIQENTGLAVKKGKLSPTGSASIRDAGDIRALQQVYDLWKPEFKKGYLTSEEYLNFRTDLGKMARYGRELTSSKPLSNLADIMRGKFNTEYRGQVAGLEALDKKFGPATSDYSRLAKDFIDSKTGELKDSAINRISNAVGKGKDALLSRLEEIKPGITQRIRVLKAVEDIQNIHKVGTYTKSALEGGGLVGGIATANIPLIATSIATILLSQPEVAVRIIRGYGKYAAPLAKAVIERVKGTAGAINSLPQKSLVKASVFGAQRPALPAVQ